MTDECLYDNFSIHLQFGHAGACASGDAEKATAKNLALIEAGAIVPKSFQELDKKIEAVYKQLLAAGVIQLKPEPAEPQIPMDFAAAQVNSQFFDFAKQFLIFCIFPSTHRPPQPKVLSAHYSPTKNKNKFLILVFVLSRKIYFCFYFSLHIAQFLNQISNLSCFFAESRSDPAAGNVLVFRVRRPW